MKGLKGREDSYDIPSPTSVVRCCRECKGEVQRQVVEKLTPRMLREGEEN